ncbi:hypothetical protein GE061_010091 [Apolygus lucorum]|uniref:Uncharacterized protein n=1 Tax=Apolygus lucorum TaxID=248454 RepID=A0A8S9Y3L0_APOLU|nr:hypothetical protein GE061_010091 [Apolygus lucorum]
MDKLTESKEQSGVIDQPATELVSNATDIDEDAGTSIVNPENLITEVVYNNGESLVSKEDLNYILDSDDSVKDPNYSAISDDEVTTDSSCDFEEVVIKTQNDSHSIQDKSSIAGDKQNLEEQRQNREEVLPHAEGEMEATVENAQEPPLQCNMNLEEMEVTVENVEGVPNIRSDEREDIDPDLVEVDPDGADECD